MTDLTLIPNDPTFRRELQFQHDRQVVELNHYRDEAARSRNLSGLQPEAPPLKTPRDMIASAAASADRSREWKASPQGRLHTAIVAIGSAGYPHTAERMRNAFSRGVSMEKTPRLVEVAFILSELASIPTNDGSARPAVMAGVAAISELLQHKTEEAA